MRKTEQSLPGTAGIRMQLGHPAFRTRNYARSMRFYTGTLGFRDKFSLRTDDDRVWITGLELAPGQQIELVPMPEKATVPEPGFAHFGLIVDDIVPAARRLEALGVPLLDGPSLDGKRHPVPYQPVRTVDGNYRFTIADPDGNDIEIAQYTEDSLQLQPPLTAVIDGIRWSLGHVALNARDYAASLRFYTETLGLTDKFSLYDVDGQVWLTYLEVAPGQFIELFPTDGRRRLDFGKGIIEFMPPKGDRFAHVCLMVDDLVTVAHRLEDQGIPLWAGPSYLGKRNPVPFQPEPVACNSLAFYIDDPDGNSVEIMQYTADSLQLK